MLQRASNLVDYLKHMARKWMHTKMNAYRNFVGKPEGKWPPRRPRQRWVNNIKMNHREIGWGGMDWTDQDLLNTVVNLCIP
jgi:hypothetical protein